MLIEKKVQENFKYFENSKVSSLCISQSIITELDFAYSNIDIPVLIENCIITNLSIHSSWFKKGLVFRNNIVLNYIDYQMGGHNLESIDIENNIFKSFFNFFDCHFDENISLVNNNFIKGSNLLGNKNEGFKNIFERKLTIEGNQGDLELDGIGIILS